jgi:hypothetical protein
MQNQSNSKSPETTLVPPEGAKGSTQLSKVAQKPKTSSNATPIEQMHSPT